MENVELRINVAAIDGNNMLCSGLNQSANIIYQNNKEKGFWDKERNIGEMLMLITSELGEAMEAHRKGKFSKVSDFETDFDAFSNFSESFKMNIKDTFEDEIADAIIRLLDLSAGLGIDIEKHINLKVLFNKSREKLHGKLY
jgi:NTP pyrophosphatase (non-canonical NTP hydrolase)